MDTHLAGLRQLVGRSCGTEPLPDAVREKAKLMLLDTIGCILAGRLAAELAELEAAFAKIESGPFRFPGGAALSTQAASAVGAIASTWDEGCEGLAYAHGRPALPIVGALLPLAVLRNASLDEALRSLVAGYEVGARMGGWLRIRPGMHVDGNWPGLGVAAAVSRLLGHSAETTLTAINIAACQLPASLYLPIRTGDNARNTYIAHSAWLGLVAAFSAQAGITAPEDALAHYAQGFAAATTTPGPEPEHYFLLDAYFKLHASVRHAHYGIEAARRIRDELRGDTRSIRAIGLKAYGEAVTYAGNRAPRVPIQGQFSLSFGVAAGLRFGGMEADIYRQPKFDDPELRRLEQLVKIEADPAMSGRSAVLTVIADGKTHEARCDRVAGDAGAPISHGEIVAKFVRYSKGAVAEEKATAFAAALMEEKHAGFGSLWAHLL